MFEWIEPITEALGRSWVVITILAFFIARLFQYIYDGEYKEK